MKQETHTAINWLDYAQLTAILTSYGFAINSTESEDDLREAVRANVADGTIDESVL